MYYKGGNMIHYIKQLFKNDEAFVQALREMNKRFYHKTVTTKQIEDFLGEKVGINLSKMFDQYLRNTSIPEVAIETNKDGFNYRWINCIDGYNIPVKLIVNGEEVWLTPTKNPQQFLYKNKINSVVVDPNFYAGMKEAVGPE
jgi:aminopeptidase N